LELLKLSQCIGLIREEVKTRFLMTSYGNSAIVDAVIEPVLGEI